MHNSLNSIAESPKLPSVRLKSSWKPLMACLALLFFALTGYSQVPSPESVLGFHPTDDKTIADWKQITEYFAKLDKASDRVLVKEIGRPTLDKPMIVAFISSPSNIKNLE